MDILDSLWYSLWTQTTLFYSNFFFGPLIAVYCAYLWRVENFNHNRNALMTAPVPIPILYLSQFLAIACVTLLTQLWVGVLYFISGRAVGMTGFPPIQTCFWLLRGCLGGSGHSRPAAVALLLHQKLCPSHSNRLTGQHRRPSFFLQGSGTLLSLFPHAPGHEFQPGRRYPLRLLPALSVKLHHFPAAFCTAGNRVPEEIGCKSIIPFFLKRAALFGRSSYLPGKLIHLRVLYL